MLIFMFVHACVCGVIDIKESHLTSTVELGFAAFDLATKLGYVLTPSMGQAMERNISLLKNIEG